MVRNRRWQSCGLDVLGRDVGDRPGVVWEWDEVGPDMTMFLETHGDGRLGAGGGLRAAPR